MSAKLRLAIVGDRDDDIPAHRAISVALARAGATLQIDLQAQWLATDRNAAPSWAPAAASSTR